MNDSTSEKTYALFSHPANKKIISELEKNGAKVFKFPPLETEKVVLQENSIFQIENLDTFDWIIFPDVPAVEYFLEILQESGIDFFEMDSLQVCAFGEAISDCLRFAQLHADVVPTSVEAAKVFTALIDYIGADEIKNKKFLLPKEISFNYQIEENLFESGVEITSLPVYQTKISDEITKLKILLKGGAIDEFIFSSPIDLTALKIYFKSEIITEILSEIKISAIDKLMFQTLKEHNLKAAFFSLK